MSDTIDLDNSPIREIDWDDGAWKTNPDSLSAYMVDGYDYRDSKKGFIIQRPKYKEFYSSFNDFMNSEIKPITNATQDPEERNKKFKEKFGTTDWYSYYNTYSDPKKSPITKENKNAGKYTAYVQLRNGKWQPQGTSSSIETVNKKIDSNYKRLQEIDAEVIINGVKKIQTFDNQKDYDEFLTKQKYEDKISRYSKKYVPYAESVHKKYEINFKTINDKRNKITKDWTPIVSNSAPVHLQQTAKNLTTLENNKKDYEAYTLLSILTADEEEGSSSSKSFIKYINEVFGGAENPNPYVNPSSEFQMVLKDETIRGVELEVFGNILEELGRHNFANRKDTREAYQTALNWLEKSTDKTTLNNAKIIQEAEGKAFDKGILDTVVSFFQSDEAIDISTHYKKAKNIINTSTLNENKQEIDRTINNRIASKTRWVAEKQPLLMAEIIQDEKSYKNDGTGASVIDDVVSDLYNDLKMEYKDETGLSRVKPKDFLLWLSEHSDEKYSETQDNEYYSFYEIISQAGYRKRLGDFDVVNSEISNLLDINTNLLGDHKTFKLSHDNYFSFKGLVNEKPVEKNNRDYHKIMIHQQPELLIKFIQTSKNFRDGSFANLEEGFNFLSLTEETYYTDLLNEAFGYQDWHSIEPQDYPEPEEMDEDFLNKNYLTK